MSDFRDPFPDSKSAGWAMLTGEQVYEILTSPDCSERDRQWFSSVRPFPLDPNHPDESAADRVFRLFGQPT